MNGQQKMQTESECFEFQMTQFGAKPAGNLKSVYRMFFTTFFSERELEPIQCGSLF